MLVLDGFLRVQTVSSGTDSLPVELTRNETQIRSPEIGPDQLGKMANRLSSPMVRRRGSSLVVFLAHLQGISFAEAAALLGTSPEQLRREVQFQVTVSQRRLVKIKRLDEILRYLHRVLNPSATGRWLHTEVPDLNGMTPFEAIRRGKITAVLNLAHSYTEPLAYT